MHINKFYCMYQGLENVLKPPYMTPSVDPEDYSKVDTFYHSHYAMANLGQWCSLCDDFSTILVLCTGCQVGLCLKTVETLTGCLEWSAAVDDRTFVYYCHFCTWKRDIPCITFLRVRVGLLFHGQTTISRGRL
jgi:hypothetical protein